MVINHHIIGRYGGHRWHGYWLKVLDVQEAFPLSTRFRLARFCSKHKNRERQTFIDIIILPCYLLVDTNHFNPRIINLLANKEEKNRGDIVATGSLFST